jgi:tripartite-type tricarboxylate transporter receptor subunit TctC
MKFPRRKFLHLAAGAAAAQTLSHVARAQAYPTRPIRLLIPFPPGGSFDAIGRPWADKMKALLGTVVVENQETSGTAISTLSMSNSLPMHYHPHPRNPTPPVSPDSPHCAKRF